MIEKAKCAFEECVMIATAIFSSNDERFLDCTSQLSVVNTMMSFSPQEVNQILDRIEGQRVEQGEWNEGWIDGRKEGERGKEEMKEGK